MCFCSQWNKGVAKAQSENKVPKYLCCSYDKNGVYNCVCRSKCNGNETKGPACPNA